MCRYLVTTFKIVPRGTEGAVSVEGTLAGILGSIALAFLGCLLGKVFHKFLTLHVYIWWVEKELRDTVFL